MTLAHSERADDERASEPRRETALAPSTPQLTSMLNADSMAHFVISVR